MRLRLVAAAAPALALIAVLTASPAGAQYPGIVSGIAYTTWSDDASHTVIRFTSCVDPKGCEVGMESTVDLGDRDAMQPAVSASGQLFFTAEVAAGGQLAIYRARGDGATRVVGGRRDASEPAVSPDGRRVAFQRVMRNGRTQVFVRDLDSGDLTKVSGGLVTAGGPAWSPDGSQLAFSGKLLIGAMPSCWECHVQIWTAPADGSGSPVNLTVQDFGALRNPDWDPGATTIAADMRFPHGYEGIALIDPGTVEATFPAILTQERPADPSWSPAVEGSHRLAATFDADGDMPLVVISDLAGTDQHPIGPGWDPVLVPGSTG